MPRNPAIEELQADASTGSPLRRSARIVGGASTSRASLESSITKATRTQKTSEQSTEAHAEIKATTRTRRASEDELNKEQVPARRGRQPYSTDKEEPEKPKPAARITRRSSANVEPTDKEEPEKPKLKRTRRLSKANSEDPGTPQKATPIKSRRRSSTQEPEKNTPKISLRRRNSAAEDPAAGEVSTPTARATRSRKLSDADDVFEEDKKPATRSRRRSVSHDEETAAKPVARRGRRGSREEENATVSAENSTESDKSPSYHLKQISITLTPIKKRPITEKVKAELDLSIINESADNLEQSKDEEEPQPAKESSPALRKRIRTSSISDSSPRKSPRFLLENKSPRNREMDKSHDSKLEKSQTDVLNSSSESTLSNKENIKLNASANVQKVTKEQTSFLEPMEVDESYMPADKSIVNQSSDILTKDSPSSTPKADLSKREFSEESKEVEEIDKPKSPAEADQPQPTNKHFKKYLTGKSSSPICPLSKNIESSKSRTMSPRAILDHSSLEQPENENAKTVTNIDKMEDETIINSQCDANDTTNITTQLGYSESTHYDFDLPSDDDDDLFDSKSKSGLEDSAEVKNTDRDVEESMATKKRLSNISENVADSSSNSLETSIRPQIEENEFKTDLSITDSAEIKENQAIESLTHSKSKSDLEDSAEDKNTDRDVEENVASSNISENAADSSSNALETSIRPQTEENEIKTDLSITDGIINEENQAIEGEQLENNKSTDKKLNSSLLVSDTSISEEQEAKVPSKEDSNIENEEINSSHILKTPNVHDHKDKRQKSVESDESERHSAKKPKAKEMNDKAAKPPTPKKEEESKGVKTRLSLDEFASARLGDYLKSKAEEEESDSESDEEASNSDCNDYIDDMAEEGEEDTPSEDSNQIIDEGESVGSSDSEDDVFEEDYDVNDSFIDDEQSFELLSGEEFDLEVKQKKKSRIINPDSLKDDDIIKIPRKAKEEKKKEKKWSRIVDVANSSDEEETSKQTEPVIDEETAEEPKHEENTSVQVVENLQPEESGPKIAQTGAAKETKKEETTLADTSFQKRSKKTSLTIHENITVDESTDQIIGKRINTLVESFCSSVKKGEISFNLSLEYEDSTETNKSDEPVHIISDVKICPLIPSVEVQGESSPRQQVGDLREILNKKGLKRKLNKSLTEISEEDNSRKRRKKQKPKKCDEQNDLRKQTFNLIGGLISDVKNRPKRLIKPSRSVLDGSWTVTAIPGVKPSTSSASKKEIIKAVPHPKDFKNRLLSDPSRVKRMDTKALLKKKGAFF